MCEILKAVFNGVRRVIFVVVDFVVILVCLPIGLPFLLYEKITRSKYKRNMHAQDATLVLIHGTGVNDFQWGMAKFYLRVQNIHYITVNYDYSQPVRKSCQDVMDQIVDQVRGDSSSSQLCKKHKLSLVGHSQGGLIARLLHNHYHKQEHHHISVNSFVLNAPQNGSKLLNRVNKLRNGTAAHKDMEHNSEFIQYYRSYCDVDINVFEIAGVNDFVDSSTAFMRCKDSKHRYYAWGSHYSTAVNPFLWFCYIIPRVKGTLAGFAEDELSLAYQQV